MVIPIPDKLVALDEAIDMLKSLGDKLQDTITEVEKITAKLEEDVMRQLEDSTAEEWAFEHDDDDIEDDDDSMGGDFQ